MIKSATLNELMLEKTALDWNDAKSFGKEVYRGGKRSVNIMKDGLMETVGDYASSFGDISDDPIARKLNNFTKGSYSQESIDFKNTRAQKNMDRIAKQHGYAYQGDNTWHNAQTGKTFRLDKMQNGPSHTTMSGPHMMGQEGSNLIRKIDKGATKILRDKMGIPIDEGTFANAAGASDYDTIRIGKRSALRNKGVLAHEFGHHLQGPKMRKIDQIARFTTSNAPRLAALNTAVGPFTYGLPATIAINKGLAGVTAAAGATVAGSELQASYLGTKHLGGRVKHRARAFAGVPSYVAAAFNAPKESLGKNVALIKRLAKLK